MYFVFNDLRIFKMKSFAFFSIEGQSVLVNLKEALPSPHVDWFLSRIGSKSVVLKKGKEHFVKKIAKSTT